VGVWCYLVWVTVFKESSAPTDPVHVAVVRARRSLFNFEPRRSLVVALPLRPSSRPAPEFIRSLNLSQQKTSLVLYIGSFVRPVVK